MRKRTITGITAAAVGVMATLTCSPVYVLRAGYEEARILSRRQPLERVIENQSTDLEVRRKLELVVQAREFAKHALELDAGESFTTYSWVDSDTLLLVVSAARKDRFEPYTWWFPIVGRVPYKGFFDFGQAHATAAGLEEQGFDTYVRPSGAFSTLGWFNDPLLNTVLRYGDVGLASTVIHELLHNTVFISSRVSFNESFANFVGDRGAIEFFCARDGDDAARCRQARAAWEDNLVFGEFLSRLVHDLETLYARNDLGREDKLARREDVFRAAFDHFGQDVQPRLQTTAFRGFADETVNNATLIGTRLYYDRLHLFEAAFQRHEGDLRATIAAVIGAARSATDPWLALEHLANGSTRPASLD